MATKTAEKKVLIIGCGIAGPIAAMFLQRAGMVPVIYEGRPEPRDEAGFFLNLAPNGLDVLDTLDIKQTVLKRGISTSSIVFQNHHGNELARNSETTILIKRGELTRILREAAIDRDIPVEFGKRLIEVDTMSHEEVTANFEDGTEANGTILIGCDGIHSRTRKSIMPNAPEPSYTEIIDTGGITHQPSLPSTDGEMRMTFGKESFFAYQVASSGEIYWFENFVQSAEPEKGRLDAISNEQWRQSLVEKHRDDHAPIAEIIQSTENIGKWPNYELPPLSTWHEGPVCLIGDAAHAMSPASGQGASMAMEDAIVLAKCLRDIPTIGDAFSTFEELRKHRVEQLAKEANQNSSYKGTTNELTRRLRDLVLPFFLKRGIKSAQQAYQYRVNWDG